MLVKRHWKEISSIEMVIRCLLKYRQTCESLFDAGGKPAYTDIPLSLYFQNPV